jgi:excisionase family DNA binding protein
MPAILPERQYLRVDEVAHYYRRTDQTIFRWIREGRMDAVKICNRGILIPTTAIVQVIRLDPECYESENR